MAEDKFGDVDFVLLVDLNRYALTIIDHRKSPIFLNTNLNLGHLMISLIIIRRIYQHFIKNLIQPGHILDLLIHHIIILQNPHTVLNSRNRSHISVRPQQDVLNLGDFLVSVFDFLLH
jgi:hypothetical protein